MEESVPSPHFFPIHGSDWSLYPPQPIYSPLPPFCIIGHFPNLSYLYHEDREVFCLRDFGICIPDYTESPSDVNTFIFTS
jgi:hypothetical protein